MYNRADWLSYIHDLRKREIDVIFAKCPPRLFEEGLEIGAGNGFQGLLLTRYILRLTCSDFNPDRLKRVVDDSIKYLICDAEHVDRYFGERQFDIVFSFNLLEHLPNPDKSLKGIHKIYEVPLENLWVLSGFHSHPEPV